MTFFVREIKLLVEECYAFHFLCFLLLLFYTGHLGCPDRVFQELDIIPKHKSMQAAYTSLNLLVLGQPEVLIT